MIIWSPGESAQDISSEVAFRTARLNAVSGKKRFLLLPVDDPREAIPWILASFQSRLAVVPFPAQLPGPAIAKLIAQLPEGESISIQELPSASSYASQKKPLDETWAVIFSSGSSGDPKGVALSGSAIRASALAHAQHSGIREGAWLLNLPLFHVGGFSVLSRTYFLKSQVAVASAKFSARETLEWIKSGQVTGLSLVPTSLRRLLESADVPFSGSLKMILLGGAPADPELFQSAKKFSAPVFFTYGMTEHCSQIATELVSGEGLVPLPNVELKIEDGQIMVRSPCLASGYFRSGKLEPLPLENGFFATGDLGELIGERLRIKGRKPDLILSGGMNVFPAEVEKELAEYPGLLDFAVSGIPDPEWGEAVCLAMVPESAMVDPNAILTFLRSRVDARKLPKRVVSLPEIPRSPLGKINRPALRVAIEKKILAGE